MRENPGKSFFEKIPRKTGTFRKTSGSNPRRVDPRRTLKTPKNPGRNCGRNPMRKSAGNPEKISGRNPRNNFYRSLKPRMK